MLKVIGAVLALVLLILKRVFTRRKPPKTAAEVLKDPSPTAQAVEEGEKKAEAKFGKRP